MRNTPLLVLGTALFVLGYARVALADDPNGDRPGLTEPPGLSIRTPNAVPETGSSGLLLGSALLGLASIPMAWRLLRRT